MYPSEIEIRQITQNHLNGGVAPSRHALTRQIYLDRQRKHARAANAVSVTAGFRIAAKRAAAAITALITRICTFWSGCQRVVR